jgi:hypothetical protein
VQYVDVDRVMDIAIDAYLREDLRQHLVTNKIIDTRINANTLAHIHTHTHTHTTHTHIHTHTHTYTRTQSLVTTILAYDPRKVSCCLLCNLLCLLSVICCLLSAVYCLLSAVCCLLSAVCCLLFADLIQHLCLVTTILVYDHCNPGEEGKRGRGESSQRGEG